MHHRIPPFLFLISIINLLTACMLGPDFQKPTPPKTKSYVTDANIKKTKTSKGVKAQHFNMAKDIPAEWWRVFHSREMNQLIKQGLAHSPNIIAAKAVLQQARENLQAQIGGTMLPQVSAGLTGTRQRLAPASLGISTPNGKADIFNLFNASVNASYSIDLFGSLRRQVEASEAQVDFQQYELQAAQLTLTSNIVITSIDIASLNEQIKAVKTIIRSQTETLSITNKQFRLGGASRSDVLAQQTELAQTKALLPPLEQSLMQNQHALAVLVGQLPSETQWKIPPLNQITLPTELPIRLPSEFVQKRPDIKAAESIWHAASANIGVAQANLFPSFTLTGGYGWEGFTLSHLINPANTIWNGGAAITQSVFNGGALMAKKRAAIAAYQEAEATYRQTVLTAFQNVADVLRALQHDADSLSELQQAETSARESLRLTKAQYRLGGSSYLNLLTAERTYQQAYSARIIATAARYKDTAALFQALGGGWWHEQS